MTARTDFCPHANIVFCPLYRAAHEPYGLGCADGHDDMAGFGTCALARGLDYPTAVARLDPREVAILQFREQADGARAQRLRNMRAAGIQ